MKYTIDIEGADRTSARIIKKCAQAALKHQRVSFPAQVNITITDDEEIRKLNREHRDVDRATDVLSFPLLDWTDGKGEAPKDYDYDHETNTVPIGDVVISMERAQAQAEEYGHSCARECGYLTVHSILHLLGYDHTDEGPRKLLMRGFEEDILATVKLARQE